MFASLDGFRWRVSSEALALGPDYTTVLRPIEGQLDCGSNICAFGNPTSPEIVLIVGDSHVNHYTKWTARNAGERYRYILVQGGSCYFGAHLKVVPTTWQAANCYDLNQRLRSILERGNIKAIIHGQRWSGYMDALQNDAGDSVEPADEGALFALMLEDIGQMYAGFPGRVILVGQSPNTNTACYSRPDYLPMRCPTGSLASYKLLAEAFDDFSNKTDLDVALVNPVDFLCSDGHCPTLDANGRILYTDDHHVSIYGAGLIVPHIIRRISEPPPIE
jgi:hypothetical protein